MFFFVILQYSCVSSSASIAYRLSFAHIACKVSKKKDNKKQKHVFFCNKFFVIALFVLLPMEFIALKVTVVAASLCHSLTDAALFYESVF